MHLNAHVRQESKFTRFDIRSFIIRDFAEASGASQSIAPIVAHHAWVSSSTGL